MKKLALIGCGGIGGYHLEHFIRMDDIELAGFCDVTLSRAEGFAEKAGGGKAYSCFKTMYDEVKPDIVFICVPPTCHGEIEFETIRRGIPFFVEKPLALDAGLARELVRQVEDKGLIAASGFQCRYDDINIPAKEFIKNNRVLHVAASRVGGVPEVPWWRNKFTSGGQLAEQTIHQMDMLRYLLEDEPDTVYSVPSRGYVTQEEWPGYFTDDMSTTLIAFKSGITCTMVTGCYSLAASAWDSKMTFGGREARMDYRLITDVTVYGQGGSDAENLGGVVSGDGMQRIAAGESGVTVNSSNDYGFECDRTFIEAAISGDASKIRSPYADAWRSVAFCLACNKSMETGMPVKVEY
ncbi:MAG: Gfo/Idh/MocA family oxidoreductase [Oscillospiraceae bacterium]|nr:Gfo/Idh/MocA family oxidoreductase [Oscillospiraceae bacterium]